MLKYNTWAEVVQQKITNEDGISAMREEVIAIEQVRLDFTADRSRKDLQLLANPNAPGTIPDRTVLVFAGPHTVLRTASKLKISRGPYKGLWAIQDPPVPVGVGLTGNVDHYEAIATETQASAHRMAQS